jgi:hypothetical protein
MAGMVRRTPTRRPAGEHWPGASTASLASALTSGSQRGMLRRGFAPPGQPAPSGNGASTVLIPHRARRHEVLALLGSRSVPAAPVRIDAAAAERLPTCPPCSSPAISSLIQPGPPGGRAWRRPEPRSPSRRERRSSPVPGGCLLPTTETGCWGLPRAWQLGQTPKEPPTGPQ